MQMFAGTVAHVRVRPPPGRQFQPIITSLLGPRGYMLMHMLIGAVVIHRNVR